jgi:hypothetical protein
MARSFSRGKKRITIGAIALLTLAGAGAAVAFWTAGGTGVGSATTGESVAFAISTDDAEGNLAPGSEGQTVGFTVTNEADDPQTLTGITVALAGPTGLAWVPADGCSIADYTVTISTPPLYGEVASEGVLTGVATITLANTGVNQNACQNQTVPLYFVAS